MSQKGVERLLGRLITDPRLRRRFFEEPADLCVREGYDLTTRELEAVLNIAPGRLEQLARYLDPKIVRAADADAVDAVRPEPLSSRRRAGATRR